MPTKKPAQSLTKPRFNDKQIAWMRSYVVCNDGTKAAIEAGYSPRSAKNQGHRMMTNDDLMSLVRKAQKRVADRQQVKAEEVIAHTRYIGLSNYFDYTKYDEDGAPYYDLKAVEERDFMLGAAISSVKTKKRTMIMKNGNRVVEVETEFKLHDKKSALILLNEATGALVNHNPGATAADLVPKVEMHMHTHIQGSPGSKIRRVDPLGVEGFVDA